ncbi:hypothetical protein ABZ208_13250 [Streptomyces sp. NPDC006208]|uniref:hypothetical protein n=1 Tax=Streptomyces sp. NPDC006208 TaxID=3156734 RepID=UPI0033B7E48D
MGEGEQGSEGDAAGPVGGEARASAQLAAVRRLVERFGDVITDRVEDSVPCGTADLVTAVVASSAGAPERLSDQDVLDALMLHGRLLQRFDDRVDRVLDGAAVRGLPLKENPARLLHERLTQRLDERTRQLLQLAAERNIPPEHSASALGRRMRPDLRLLGD